MGEEMKSYMTVTTKLFRLGKVQIRYQCLPQLASFLRIVEEHLKSPADQAKGPSGPVSDDVSHARSHNLRFLYLTMAH